MNDSTQNRRPIKARSSRYAQKITHYLVSKNINPNQISVASIVFAVLGAVSLVCLKNYFGFLLCCVFIQLRLLCNLFDGMVAIEGQKKSVLGAVYNEFPDRIADSVLLIALGYSVFLVDMGYLAALLAALTAYVRVFGGSLQLPQTFMGPMAKQHRMALMSIACLVAQIEYLTYQSLYSLLIALFIIIIGSAITCVTRTLAISKQLKGL